MWRHLQFCELGTERAAQIEDLPRRKFATLVKFPLRFSESTPRRGIVTARKQQACAVTSWDTVEYCCHHISIGERVFGLVLGLRQCNGALDLVDIFPAQRCDLAPTLPGKDKQLEDISKRITDSR